MEIEFAVNLSPEDGRPKEFGFLQIRPMALAPEVEEIEIDEFAPSSLVCRSKSVLGHGLVEGIRDIVVADYHRFDRSKSRAAAEQTLVCEL